jgi:uncharacterized metal-binding protein
MMESKKVLMIPCSGIGKPIGSVGRDATYEIIENLRPGDADTICLASLTLGEDEVKRKVTSNYCITLDGCPMECAKKNVEALGKKPDKSYRIIDFFKDNPGKKPSGIVDIGEGGRELSKSIADAIVKDVDDLLGSEVK